MIEFLQPLFWLAGLAAAVPILLHLMRRQQARRIEFPAVRYLRQAEQRHARRLRIRHLLLLALRAALLIMLAAAAAGPLIGRGGPGDHRPTALAIVLDNSQSTGHVLGDRRLLDLFRDRARQALSLIGPDDRVALFTATDPERSAAALDAEAAIEFVERLSPVPARADLPGALARAREWLESAAEGRAAELHVMTDLQRVSLAAGNDPAEDGSAGADRRGASASVVAFVPIDRPRPNGAPDDPVPEILPLNADEEARIAVPLRWFGPDPPEDPVVVRLVVSGNLVGAAEAPFGGTALLTLPAQRAGWVQGHIEIDRHGLPADDRRYFTWRARPRPRVSLAGDPGAFLVRALDALERGGRIRRVERNTAEVLVAHGGEGGPEALAAGRAVVIVPPVDPLELPRLNSRLEQARVPWRYEPPTATGSVRIQDPAPVEGLRDLEVRQAYRLVRAGGARGDTSLARLPGGDAWIVRGTTPEGAAYILLGSPLDPSASGLPVSAAMVPFMDALLGEWARSGDFAATRREGIAPIQLPMRARTLRAEGDAATVEPGSWFRPVRAGNYGADDGDTILTAFSVNAPVAEADLMPGDREDLTALLPGADWTWVTDETRAWTAEIFRARRGRLSWRPLIALVLLFAIVETAVAASGRRQERESRVP